MSARSGIAISAAVCLLAGGCTSASSIGARPAVLSIPVAQVRSADSERAWVTLAMGQLSDPANTFWQLFLSDEATNSWGLVTPPGVATNGGLLLSPGAGGALTVGFGISADLSFSPLSTTPDLGKTWLPGLLPGALANTPDALAAGSGPTAAALLADGTVQFATSDLSQWSTITSRATLTRTSSGARCRLVGLTSVATTPTGEVLVGAACSSGVIAIFDLGDPAVARVAPTAAGTSLGTVAGGHTEVLRLVATATSLEAVVRVGGSEPGYLVMTHPYGSSTWSISPIQRVSGALVSTSLGPNGAVALVTSAARAPQGEEWNGDRWELPVTLPGGASLLELGSNNQRWALSAHGSTLVVQREGPSGWGGAERFVVPVQYGSSSGSG